MLAAEISVAHVNKQEGIEAAFLIEEESGKVAVTPDDIPFNYERITPSWWTGIVCPNDSGAQVETYRAEPPDDLDRGHMRVRLTYNDTGRAMGLPDSVFCKDSQKLGLRVFSQLVGTTWGEVFFYNQVRPLLDLNTPKCLFAKHDATSFNSMVVMEDLLPQGAQFCDMATPVTRDMIERQLAYLARLHARFHDATSGSPIPDDWRTLSDFYMAVDEVMDLAANSEKGFLASEAVIPPRLFARHAEIWPATRRVLESHRRNPHLLGHNDAHIRNWYVCANGDVGLADWQVISRSGWGHDVTFTISTSLTVEHRRAWERDLLRFYLERLRAEGGPALEFNDAWNNYRRHLFLSLLGWTPIVKPSSEYEWQPQNETQEVIRRVSTAIDDLDAFECV